MHHTLLNRYYMKFIRLLLLFAIAVTALAWFSHTKAWKRTTTLSFNATLPGTPGPAAEKLEQKAAEAKLFVRRKGYNENHCFLIDMSLASGKNRFFIYDLANDSIQAMGLVAHGNCFEYWLEGRKYSNVVGSGCTSLGKYKIGAPYTGKFGYSYKLHGLDSSNNNALERTVVLHSHSCVPDTKVDDEICQSNGCPTVSPALLQQLKQIINGSRKPVLLWIYQ